MCELQMMSSKSIGPAAIAGNYKTTWRMYKQINNKQSYKLSNKLGVWLKLYGSVCIETKAGNDMYIKATYYSLA